MWQKIPIVRQIVRQSILNFKCFGGVLNSVLIGTLDYLSDGIDTLSVGIICCFILVSNRPKTMSHKIISSRKKIHPTPPPPTSKN